MRYDKDMNFFLLFSCLLLCLMFAFVLFDFVFFFLFLNNVIIFAYE